MRERARRMVREHRGEHDSLRGPVSSIAKIGCTVETLRRWVQQMEKESGQHEGLSASERERIEVLDREVRELRPANEVPRKASSAKAA